MLEFALAYAQRGWSVFPLYSIGPDGKCECENAVCDRPGKHPRNGNGHHGSTTHEPLIRYWWGQWPTANIGISVEESGLAVLDVDIGEGKQGHESLAELERVNGSIPTTPTSITGSGGIHALFERGDAPGGRKIGFLANLDLLSKGYIVAPPSKHVSGNTYRWATDVTELAPLPNFLRTVFAQSRPESPPAAEHTGGRPATPEVIEAARQRLARHGPAISGNGGDAHTFQAGAILFRGFALTFEDAWPLALEWNRTCLPPWSEEDLAAKLGNGMRYGSGGGEERALVEAKAAMQAIVAASKPAPVTGPDGRRSVRLADAARKARPPIRWYPSGIRGLDERLGGGFYSRAVHTVMGPPGVGKTGFVVGVAMSFATQGPVLHVSTELETEEMAARYAAHIMKVDWTDIERGKYPGWEARLDELRVRCIGYDQLSRVPSENLLTITHELIAEPGAALIVDYLQDMVSSTMDNQRGVVGELATNLRMVVQELDVPCLAVSSVSRANYKSDKVVEDAEYYKGAAKEAGEIDFASANLLFLEVQPMTDDTHSHARIAVAKARRGRTGFVGAKFYGGPGRWEYAPEVLGSFEKASSTRYEARHAEDEAAVMKVVRQLAERGEALGKRQLRELIPGIGGVGKADQALQRLITRGDLSLVESYYTNQGRTMRREVVALPTMRTEAKPVPAILSGPALSFLPKGEQSA